MPDDTHIPFPRIHPSFTNANISIGIPTAAMRNSTVARLIRMRLYGDRTCRHGDFQHKSVIIFDGNIYSKFTLKCKMEMKRN